MGISNLLKRGYLATKDKLTDIHYFFKPSNADNKIKHAFHELEYCNDRAKLTNDPTVYQKTCQEAYSKIRGLLSEQLKNSLPNEHSHLLDNVIHELPQNYSQGNFQIIKGLYKVYIACLSVSDRSNEECNIGSLNEVVGELMMVSALRHSDEYNNWLHDEP